MINKIHFPFPTQGEIFISPKQIIEEKVVKKEAELPTEVSVLSEGFVHTPGQVLKAMQAQSVALDMLKLKVTRKQLIKLTEEQPQLALAESSKNIQYA